MRQSVASLTVFKISLLLRIQNNENMSRKKIQKNEKKLSELGLRIHTLLLSENLNQSGLADLLGLSNSYITELMHGRTKKGGIKFWDAIRSNLPDWENYLRNSVKKPPPIQIMVDSEINWACIKKEGNLADKDLEVFKNVSACTKIIYFVQDHYPAYLSHVKKLLELFTAALKNVKH